MLRMLATAAAVLVFAAGAASARQADIPDTVLALHTSDGACESLADLANGEDTQSYDMGGNSTLYIIPCSSGAYNFGYRFYLDADGFLIRQLFGEYSDYMGWYGTDMLFLLTFDPDAGVLNSYYKGRGIGDCGTAGTWQWDGSQFVMVEYRDKEDCDGVDSEWPIIFSHPNPPVWVGPNVTPTTADDLSRETPPTKDKISQ